MEIDITTIIDNAMKVALKDGYPQIIYKDSIDGSYSFTRLYSKLVLFNCEEIYGIVEHKYCLGGVAKAKFTLMKEDINNTIKFYNVVIKK